MYKKKYLIILLLSLIIAIGAISHVSASDLNVDDEIVSSDASVDEVSVDNNIQNDVVSSDASVDEVSVDNNIQNDVVSSDVSVDEVSANKEIQKEIASADLNNDEIISAVSNTKTLAENDNSSNESSNKSEEVKKVSISASKLTAVYKSSKKFNIKVFDADKKVVSGLKLKIKVYTGKKYKTFNAKTNSKGIATIKVNTLNKGSHKVVIETNDALYTGNASSLIKINKNPVKITAAKISALYKSTKKLKIKVVDSEKKAVSGLKLKIKVYTGKKYKTLYAKTNSKGIASVKATAFKKGKHKVIIQSTNSLYPGKASSLIKIKKNPVKITAPKITTIYKSTKKFKVKVVDSQKNAVSGLKLKIKVYTGKKYKIYKVKTNSKGIATIKVTALKLGKHKVIIQSTNSLLPGKASSRIKINKRPVIFQYGSAKFENYSVVAGLAIDKALLKYRNGIPVKLVVYTGKKHQTFKMSTSFIKSLKKYGGIMFYSNAFSAGKHKVKLMAYGNYKGSITFNMTVLKSAAKNGKKNGYWYAYFKKGKIVQYIKKNGKWVKYS